MGSLGSYLRLLLRSFAIEVPRAALQVRHCSRAREYVDLMCSSIDLSDRPHEYGPYTLNSVLRLVLAFDSLVLALLRRTDLYFALWQDLSTYFFASSFNSC